MQVAVVVPQLTAQLCDTEYQMVLAILAANFGEQSDMPADLQQLHSQLVSSRVAAQAQARARAQGQAPAQLLSPTTSLDAGRRQEPSSPRLHSTSEGGRAKER
jgi:hypothetical protein